MADESRFTLRPIGLVHSPFEKGDDVWAAPKETASSVEIFEDYEAGLKDVDGFSHIQVIFLFDRAGQFEPERLVTLTPWDDEPHGVFATRSPHRPNPIASTVVRLVRREGRFLTVAGLDALNGSPVLDIKPCTSSVPEGPIERGWIDKPGVEERLRARARRGDPD